MSPTEPPIDLVGLIVRVHEALDRAGLPHAFGGALALAWCIHEPRATADIDLNVFVPVDDLDRLLAALPAEVEVSPRMREGLERDGQARLWWTGVPLDVFMATDEFHSAVAGRIMYHPLLSTELPFLACRDLAVFKAFFDRGKDWVDIEQMVATRSFDVSDVIEVLADHLGPDDSRITRLEAMQGETDESK